MTTMGVNLWDPRRLEWNISDDYSQEYLQLMNMDGTGDS
jgi:hypothetical protein